MKAMPRDTQQLIQSLSRSVPRVPRHALQLRLALGMLAGALVTLALVTRVLGVNPHLATAMHGFSFWMKLIYSLSIGVGAFIATARLARPTDRSWRWMAALGVPFLLLAGIGIGELARAPVSEWLAMWLGRSWKMCPWLVLTLALPIFAGLLWSFRRLAPTQLRAAGAAAGLTAGAWAAAVYCLHCPETTAVFVLTWYTLGMALASLVGALLGPRLLRW